MPGKHGHSRRLASAPQLQPLVVSFLLRFSHFIRQLWFQVADDCHLWFITYPKT